MNANKYVRDTTVVGSYPPNGYGLYDMAGNVLEWCLDAYQWDFYRNSPRRNPVAEAEEEDSETSRVLRGGSWIGISLSARVAARSDQDPRFTSGTIGFRCVKSVTP